MSLVSANKTDTNTYTVEIDVSADDFKKAVTNSYLKNRKSITIPGFRKGKAPKHMIETLYGEDFFYEDALEAVFPEQVESAYKEAEIHPVDQPENLDIKNMNVTDGLHLTFTVTVKPEITVSQYKGIEAEKAEPEVTDEEVDSEIKYMLERGSRIVDVDDRAVQDGDIAVIDFEGFVDGVAFEGGKGEKYNLTIGSKQFIPGFEEQIIGHGIGDEFEISVKFPEDYSEELASKDAVFKVKVDEIKFKEIPELDDDFAKDQDYDTVAELKEGVKNDLLAHKTEDIQHKFEDSIVETLCKNVEGEIPECMYDAKADENIQNFSNRVQQQGIDVKTYLSYMGLDEDSFKKMMRERAVDDVKYELAVEKVIELENIEAAEEEIEKEIAEMAEQYKLDAEKIKEIVPQDAITDQLKKRAAAKLIIDSAVATAPKAEKEETDKTENADDNADKSEEKPAE